MKRTARIILALLFCLTINETAWSQGSFPYEPFARDASIMRPDRETRLRWLEDYEIAPRAPIDREIGLRLSEAESLQAGTSVSLLNHLEYVPADRDQGYCGNCWVWAGTGIMEVALSVQNGIRDRFSTQFLNSCKTGQYACCGGNLSGFSSWYAGKGLAIPWSNAKASFEDDLRDCSDHKSAVSCGSIASSPSYSISSIQAQVIETTGVGQTTAIANIKNMLHQEKAVWFSFFLVEQTDWDFFFDYWDHQPEAVLWSPDSSCGHKWTQNGGGGHAVLIVGYNDEDPNPSNHYWVALNSWGTADGNRPNGIFHLAMYMNYDCKINETGNGEWYSTQFWTLNVNFGTPSDQAPNLTPYKPAGWQDKIIVSSTPGASSSSGSFSPTDSLYVGWGVINDSIVPGSDGFFVSLYVDGVLRNSWYYDSLGAGNYVFVTDYLIGSLGAGTHTLKIAADSSGTLHESSESDNEYSKTMTVGGSSSGVDLTGSWTSVKQPCANSFSNPTCRIIGALKVRNTGNQEIVSSYVDFYLSDGSGETFLKRVSLNKLKAGASRTALLSYALPSGQKASGKYLLAVIDPGNTIAEINETNNEILSGPIP